MAKEEQLSFDSRIGEQLSETFGTSRIPKLETSNANKKLESYKKEDNDLDLAIKAAIQLAQLVKNPDKENITRNSETLLPISVIEATFTDKKSFKKLSSRLERKIENAQVKYENSVDTIPENSLQYHEKEMLDMEDKINNLKKAKEVVEKMYKQHIKNLKDLEKNRPHFDT